MAATWEESSSNTRIDGRTSLLGCRPERSGIGIAIEPQPEDSERSSEFLKLFVHDGFHEVAAGAELIGVAHVGLGSRGRQYYHRNVTQCGVALDVAQHLETVHPRQPQVEQDQL